MLIFQDASLGNAERYDGANVFGLGDDLRRNVWLVHMIEFGRIREITWIIHHFHFAIRRVGVIRNVRNGGDHRHIEFTIQSLLDNFKMKHAEKTAAESEAQRN